MGRVIVEERVEVRTEAMDPELVALWDAYAQDGYGDIHKLPCFHRMDKVLEGLFVRTPGARVLDAGCGEGSFLLAILRSIHSASILAVDWSEEMLRGARRQAGELLESQYSFEIDFEQRDLSQDFPWPDGSFDALVSHMLTCFIAKPWREVMSEMYRVTKKGGYIYLTTFLADWDFSQIVKKHFLSELFRSPVGLWHGLRLKRHAAPIAELARSKGLIYPSKEDLSTFFAEKGAREVVQEKVFWGAGAAVRVQVA